MADKADVAARSDADRAEEIRTQLAGAYSGPWFTSLDGFEVRRWDDPDDHGNDPRDLDDTVHVAEPNGGVYANMRRCATFIAAAPQTAQWALAQYARAERAEAALALLEQNTPSSTPNLPRTSAGSAETDDDSPASDHRV